MSVAKVSCTMYTVVQITDHATPRIRKSKKLSRANTLTMQRSQSESADCSLTALKLAHQAIRLPPCLRRKPPTQSKANTKGGVFWKRLVLLEMEHNNITIFHRNTLAQSHTYFYLVPGLLAHVKHTTPNVLYRSTGTFLTSLLDWKLPKTILDPFCNSRLQVQVTNLTLKI